MSELSSPLPNYNGIPNHNHDFLILQISDATFLAAPQLLHEIIGYVGAVRHYRFAKKQELIDTWVLHMVYTRKETAFTQHVHELL